MFNSNKSFDLLLDEILMESDGCLIDDIDDMTNNLNSGMLLKDSLLVLISKCQKILLLDELEIELNELKAEVDKATEFMSLIKKEYTEYLV